MPLHPFRLPSLEGFFLSQKLFAAEILQLPPTTLSVLSGADSVLTVGECKISPSETASAASWPSSRRW